MRVYQFRHVGTDTAQQLCYYIDRESFAPDELLHSLLHINPVLQIPPLTLRETRIIEQSTAMSKASQKYF